MELGVNILEYTVETIFSLALFVNALLFIPQALRIFRKKNSSDVSLMTFLGFLLIQFAIVLHGFIVHDYKLVIGYVISMVTCGIVVALIFIYRKPQTDNIDQLPLESIIKQIPGHLYWKDIYGKYQGANTKNWHDLGFLNKDDYIGKNDYDVLPASDADKIRLIDDTIIRTGKNSLNEEWVQERDNIKRLYLSDKAPLKNHEGKIIGIIGISINITKMHKETVDKLKMLEDIIAVMPGHVYWVDKDNVYLGCNDLQAKSAGLKSRKDIIGLKNKDLPWSLNQGAKPEVIDKANFQIMQSGEAITIEEPAILKDGTKATFLSSKVPLKNDQDEVVGMVGISIDITDRKKQEVELHKAKKVAVEANQMKSNFISNMEHDIRSPFVPIVTFSRALSDTEQDPQKKQYLKFIMDAGNELLNYCNGILDFSRLEAGTLAVLDKKFSLPELLERILKIERITAKHANLTLDFQYDKQIPDVLLGDHVRIERILLNLLSNAIKFTDQGSVSLSVELAAQEEHNVLVRFTVTDTGIGIPADKQDYIFERFSRLTKSNQGKYKGMGVGLPIVKQFMAELDGEIDLVSEPGKGTTFSCMIPLGIPLSDEILKTTDKDIH